MEDVDAHFYAVALNKWKSTAMHGASNEPIFGLTLTINVILGIKPGN